MLLRQLMYPFVCTATLVMLGVTVGTTAPVTPAGSRLVSDVDGNAQRSFITFVRGQLDQERFADLDRLAEELSLTKARFPGGDWKLYRFYGAVGRPAGGEGDSSDRAIARLVGRRAPGEPDWGDVRNDETWDRHLARIRAWRAARPGSGAAAVALGDTLVGYAWKARGAGYVDTVSSDGMRLFEERLEQAAAVLNESNRQSARDPHWYSVRIDLARGQGSDRHDVEKLFEEAAGFAPLYEPLYSATARFLAPRWYGDEGDWEKFAEAATMRVGGREGSAVYAHIAAQMSIMYGARQFFDENRLSWSMVKQAFVDREALYGTNLETLNLFCLLAGTARDKATASKLFERIGEAWHPGVWKEQRYFDSYRRWALQQ